MNDRGNISPARRVRDASITVALDGRMLDADRIVADETIAAAVTSAIDALVADARLS